MAVYADRLYLVVDIAPREVDLDSMFAPYGGVRTFWYPRSDANWVIVRLYNTLEARMALCDFETNPSRFPDVFSMAYARERGSRDQEERRPKRLRSVSPSPPKIINELPPPPPPPQSTTHVPVQWTPVKAVPSHDTGVLYFSQQGNPTAMPALFVVQAFDPLGKSIELMRLDAGTYWEQVVPFFQNIQLRTNLMLSGETPVLLSEGLKK